MTKRDLESIARLREKINLRYEQIAEMRTKIFSIKQSKNDGDRVQASLPRSPLEEQVVRYVDREKQLLEMIRQAEDRISEIIDAIDSMNTPRYIEMLRLRYLAGQTQEEMAITMNYTQPYVCRELRAAVIEFETTTKEL